MNQNYPIFAILDNVEIYHSDKIFSKTPGMRKRMFYLINFFPKKVSHHAKRVGPNLVTDFKNLNENVNFYFYSTSIFVRYLGLKIV